jgi:hypothetical protein
MPHYTDAAHLDGFAATNMVRNAQGGPAGLGLAAAMIEIVIGYAQDELGLGSPPRGHQQDAGQFVAGLLAGRH